MKAIVNQKTCIGCTLCSGIAEDIFEMDYEVGKAVAKKGVVIGPDNEDKAKDAEQNCPVNAISLKE